MKNVRFEIGESTLTYIYNEAPRFIINSSINLEVNRNGSLSREELMEGLRVEDDHDGNTLNEKVVIGDFDTNTIGEKEIEYSVVDSWGRSSMIKRKITVYPYSPLEYNYITLGYVHAFEHRGGHGPAACVEDRKSTRLNSSHSAKSRMPSSA